MILKRVSPSLGAALLIFSFGLASAQQQGAPAPVVTVAPAATARVDASASYTGRIEAVKNVQVFARVDGFVEAIGFTEGGEVAEGDALFEIEPDAYEAAVEQVRGQLAAAEAEKTLADIEVDRQQQLVDRQTAAEAVLQRAQAEQGKVVGQIQQLQGSLRAAELSLSYTKITAPFAGRVGLSEIDVGAFVGPSSGALVTLSSVDPIYVTFPVPEKRLLDVRDQRAANPELGPPTVEITLANGAKYAEQGDIEIVDTAVQAGTDTIIVRASFANPDGQLIDGQLVEVRVIQGATEDSVVIPATSLQRDQGGYFIYIVKDDNTAERRTVDIGTVDGTNIVVRNGVEAGETVVVEGVQRVRPGAPVDPEAAQPPIADNSN